MVRVAVIMVIALATFIGNVLMLGTPLICRWISDCSKKDIRMEVVKRQIEHLCKAAKLDESQMEGVDPYFAKRVLYLQEQMRKEPKLDSVENLYRDFKNFVRDEKFMQIFDALDKDHPAIHFLKTLSIEFRSTPMEDQIIQYVKDRYVGKPNLEGIASFLKSHQEQRGFQRKGLNLLFWAVAHPDYWLHSLDSVLFPHVYNNQQSNPAYCAHKMSYLGKQLHFIVGPTPFQDPVHQKIFSRAGKELRFNVMDWFRGHERGWIERMQQISEESEGLKHVVMGFTKGEFLKFDQIESLIDTYQIAIRDKSSCITRIDEHLLSDEEIVEAAQKAKEIFRDVDLKDVVTRHAILVAFDAIMAAQIIHKQALETKEKPLHIAIACKQCFDRGPVYFAAILYFLNDGRIDENISYLLAGLPIFRAPLNENRKMLDEQFRVYERLLNLLASSGEKRAHL